MSTAVSQDDFGVLDFLVTPEEKEEARNAYVTQGITLDDWIAKKNIDPVVLAQAKAKFYNVPFIKLADQATSPQALSFVDKTVATRLQVMPFEYRDGVLHLAMANPVDIGSIEFIEKKAGIRVKPYVAVPEEIAQAIELRYEQSLSSEVTAALKESGETGSIKTKSVDIRKMGEVIKEAPIAKIVTTVLEFAVKSRSSDVHIEPGEDKTRVRYRIDGILHEKLVLPRKIHDSLVSRIKILSDLKIDERRIPQDGRFNFQIDGEEVDLRVSTLPTTYGEKIVMRLLKKTGAVPSLQDLGLRGRALKNLEEAVLRPHGIILSTGPTGSGKTTTLYSLVSKINSSRVNIVTIEDPVEYQMPGVNQVQINPQAGLTFASGLRAFLRQDPNIIMVGEIRDEETAELAVQAALTGHLVFSTLHTSSAAGALPRLLDMKAEPYLLASSITAIIAQRVGRRICNACKKAYLPTAEEIAELKQVLGNLYDQNKAPQFFRGEGCTECGNTGFKGRIGIFEVLVVSEKIGRLILEHSPASVIEKQAVEEGMITMKQDGYLKVVEGVTTIDEILRIAQE